MKFPQCERARRSRERRKHLRFWTLVPLLALLQLALLPSAPHAETRLVRKSQAEQLRLGERMYREGILPSGQLMKVKGITAAPGTGFACVSCHLRSGLGSVQEGIITPAANGANLFKPSQIRYLKYGEDNSLYFPTPVVRPPYSDASVARAIRSGVDPAGRTLDEVMPRYLLTDREMSILVGYLNSLSSQFSPGVSSTTVRLATVVTDDVPQEERDALLVPLQRFITARNNQAEYLRKLSTDKKLRTVANLMPPPSHSLSLSVWSLKGAPATWRAQLETYYRKEPVFALVGGISQGDWSPVHRFSEENGIPSLFPATEFPVLSRSDWYTVYLSKGYVQEGEAAAGYLNGNAEKLAGRRVLQVVRDTREGRALAQGFTGSWHDPGHGAPVTVAVQPGEDLAARLRQLLAQEKPAAVVLWDGPAALAALEVLAAAEHRPELVIVSSGYLGKSLYSLPDAVRDLTYVTYPFRMSPTLKTFDGSNPALRFSADTTRGGNQAYAIAEVLTKAFADMKGNYYRDYFIDVITMLEGVDVPLYERLSFGPGLRYASKGCYIVQLSKGPKPELIKKSDLVP
jgi:ABC-type branched-subunit amino acid transport system substrate-binding protein